jgi:DNA repair ATPase RecN
LVLANKAYTPQEIEATNDLFAQVLGLEPANDYLREQFKAWQRIRQEWQRREGLKRQIRVALSGGDWEAAAQMLEEVESETDLEILELQQRVRDTEQASSWIKRAKELLENGRKTEDLQTSIGDLQQALILFGQVDSLNLRDEVGAEAQVEAGQLGVWVQNLERAAEHEHTAKDAAGRRNYEQASDMMHQAYLLVYINPIIQKRFK